MPDRLNVEVYRARLKEFGSWGLTVDFGILLMSELDDETCWSEFYGGLGGDGWGGWGSEGVEWGRFGVRMRAMWWEVVAGRNVIE